MFHYFIYAVNKHTSFPTGWSLAGWFNGAQRFCPAIVEIKNKYCFVDETQTRVKRQVKEPIKYYIEHGLNEKIYTTHEP